MTDLESRFHAEWLGLVQPVEGLVVSVPVLADAQCMRRLALAAQQHLADLAPAPDDAQTRRIADLAAFLADVLDWTPDLYDAGPAVPDDLSLYVPEGSQTLRPTLALQHPGSRGETPDGANPPADATPASQAGAGYVCLLWDLPPGLPLDKPETVTGPWEYPPAAKFDRLLRACRVPVGVLTNREVVRLVYAPHGESSGSITFRVDDMASVAGRPLFDAFVMLLGAERFFGVAPEHQLPALLRDSRTRQANVTNELADQLLDALHVLLAGFVGAAERDGHTALNDALTQANEPLYKGLLTVLLRLVFVLYAEDRGLLPVEHPVYAEHLSVLGLFADLQRDHGEHPDSMARRFGAWPRLVAVFRAVYLGLRHGDLVMPARRGDLFDPHRFAFLEGWGPAGAAPVNDSDAQKHVRVPTVDDDTVFRVLEKLLVFQGQRLSYRVLDVEQIGAVYEALMGFHVVRLPGPAVCLRGARVWVAASEVLAEAPAQRGAWVAETAGLPKSAGTKLADALKKAADDASVLAALEPLRVKGSTAGRVGQLVIQPGQERRRTSSHYTPPSLTGPIVRRTLEPLLAAMGAPPASERLLDLKVCDPAMGSGAFLVEACRFLADQVVAAWTREGRLDLVADTHGDVVLHARRLVAQRCLYGVDKNPLAVSLAKLSLWLVTLAKDEPFTFVDHALRHGDSLVGLDLEQLRSFHWKPGTQLELGREVLDTAFGEAVEARGRILALAGTRDGTREKEHLLWDANDALMPARLVADLVVGAFFAKEKDKDREKERQRRLDLVLKWLESREPPPEELLELQRELRAQVPAFHWAIEFPEVFWSERADPLDGDKTTGAAWMDAFVGNPPFMGQSSLSGTLGDAYRDWLFMVHPGAQGKSDLCAHFFRRTWRWLGTSGTLGLIATNTIAQGDTRESGLGVLMREGAHIYEAVRSMPWPGDASVAVAVVHVAKGEATPGFDFPRLDGRRVAAINSRLEAKPERAEAVALGANAELSFKGCEIGGQGFVLTSPERERLVARAPRNAERIFRYVGGEDVNTSPVQDSDRLVIDFAQMALEQVECWPDLLAIVRERVKPDRDRANREGRRRYWWRFGEVQPSMRAAIEPLSRCLVTARVTKHLCFSFQPTDRVLNEKLYVFPLDRHTAFAVLQSRVHGPWTWLLSSTMKTDLNYSASDCFETFPFPQHDPRAAIPSLEDVGERLYTARAKYMVDTNQGLTQTYNQLKDSRCREPRVVELRRLHEAMDRAVLVTYGWNDLAVPAYGTPTTEAEKAALERFEDAVIDRLFALNAQRAEAERRAAGASAMPTKGGVRGRKKGTIPEGPQTSLKLEE